MAQFDVYPNLNAMTNKHYPYFVDIQNDLLEDLETRVVIPLGVYNVFGQANLNRLTPVVEYDGGQFLMLMPQMASVSVSKLSVPIGSLTAMRDTILGSLDFLISGF